jgi:hypothetical protein
MNIKINYTCIYTKDYSSSRFRDEIIFSYLNTRRNFTRVKTRKIRCLGLSA